MPDKYINAIDIDQIEKFAPCSYTAIVECPVCHYALDPRVLCGYYAENRADRRAKLGYSHTVYLLAFCPKCRHAFLSEYRASASVRSFGQIEFNDAKFVKAYPTEPLHRSFSENIQTISPRFVDMFN